MFFGLIHSEIKGKRTTILFFHISAILKCYNIVFILEEENFYLTTKTHHIICLNVKMDKDIIVNSGIHYYMYRTIV